MSALKARRSPVVRAVTRLAAGGGDTCESGFRTGPAGPRIAVLPRLASEGVTTAVGVPEKNELLVYCHSRAPSSRNIERPLKILLNTIVRRKSQREAIAVT